MFSFLQIIEISPSFFAEDTAFEAGVRVQIHSQAEPPFVHELGFGVAPGFQTFVATQEQRVSSLLLSCLHLLSTHWAYALEIMWWITCHNRHNEILCINVYVWLRMLFLCCLEAFSWYLSSPIVTVGRWLMNFSLLFPALTFMVELLSVQPELYSVILNFIPPNKFSLKGWRANRYGNFDCSSSDKVSLQMVVFQCFF